MPRKSKETVKKIAEKQPEKKAEIKVVKNHSQILRGRVVSAKTVQTVSVLVERRVVDPFYHKAVKKSKKFLAQDDLKAREGDIVEIAQIRPISKNKHFAVIKIVGRDIEAIVTEQLKEEAAEAIEEVMPEEKEEVVEESKESEQPEKKEETKKDKKEKK